MTFAVDPEICISRRYAPPRTEYIRGSIVFVSWVKASLPRYDASRSVPLLCVPWWIKFLAAPREEVCVRNVLARLREELSVRESVSEFWVTILFNF